MAGVLGRGHAGLAAIVSLLLTYPESGLAEWTRPDRQLAAELSRLRRLSGLSVGELIEAIGSPRVSRLAVFRIEAAETLPSTRVVTAWLEAVAADRETRARVLALSAAAQSETGPWEPNGQRSGLPDDVAARRDWESVRVRTFQPTLIPSLLQTAEYARWLASGVTGGQVDPAAIARAQPRRQEVLRQADRLFQFVVTPWVLRDIPADLAGEQMAHIAELVDLPTVELVVLPELVCMAGAWHNFAIHDAPGGGRYVATELIHGPLLITHDPEVERYVLLWERLWAAAEPRQ